MVGWLLLAIAPMARAGDSPPGVAAPQAISSSSPVNSSSPAVSGSSAIADVRADFGTPAGAAPTTIPDTAGSPTVVIHLQDEINDLNRDQLFKDFAEARRLGAKTVILDIDTYGGLVTSGLDISRFIKRQDDLHVIAFVEDKAISAGAMIAMACDEIVMSGSSTLGDCAPIVFGPQGLDTMGEAERAKAQSPVLLDFDESARRNHRDPLLAAGMVDVTRVVYWVQSDQGEKKFVDQKDHDALIATKHWTDVPGAPSPVKDDKTLLTVDGEQAVQYGLASERISTIDALVQQRGYRVVSDIQPGWGVQLVQFLSGETVRGFFIVVLMLCIFVIPHAPGHGAAELIGISALVMILGVPMLTGYAQWWEVLMVFVGLLLIGFEILLPGHIFPGVTGAILVLVGLVLTFIPKEPGGTPAIIPNLRTFMSAAQGGLTVVAASLCISVFLWLWLGRYLPKLPYVNRLILTATSGGPPATASAVNKPTAPASIWPPVGAVGRVVTELKPGGSAEFFDPATADRKITAVISESGFIVPGSEVIVREASAAAVIVRAKT
jgi:membrane-bound serine protease (ClpP class)